MTLYTSQQLKEKFRLSREQHQREREEKKKQRQLQYKALCHQADQLLKEAQEQAKKQLMLQLQALAPKKPQRALKQPSQPHYNIYNTNLIEREPSDRDLYLTREELKRWEATHWNCINWSKWEQVVRETRQMLGL